MDAMIKIYELAHKSKYQPNTFIFVHEVLQACAERQPKHLTGKQLTLAAFIFSIKKYGRLARTVWEQLGLDRSEDLGAVVFLMVEAGLMSKQDEDRIEDFNGLLTVEDFDRVEVEVLGTGGRWKYVEGEDEGLKIGYRLPDDLESKLI
jgi:uncharacterized repeat protein (TIGR04138 family)